MVYIHIRMCVYIYNYMYVYIYLNVLRIFVLFSCFGFINWTNWRITRKDIPIPKSKFHVVCQFLLLHHETMRVITEYY